MSHPIDHAKKSASIWGGDPEEYMHIHQWLDATKETFADFRHRALRHHSQGIFECERTFGTHFKNSVGKDVPVRYVCEQHIKEDCDGFIPSVSDWFRNIKPEKWMFKGYKIEVQDEAKSSNVHA